jgi:hypothetical protein
MESAADFRSKAANCRALAGTARDEVSARNLLALADEYDEQAMECEAAAEARPTLRPE